MGWTYSSEWRTKKDVVEHCVSGLDQGVKKLAHSVKGNSLWVLLERITEGRKGEVLVALCLLQKDGDMWGYKDMDDSCGLYHYNCPLSYIEKTAASCRELSVYVADWHEKVKAYHRTQAENARKVKQLKAGSVVKFCRVAYELLEKYEGRKGWRVRAVETGAQFRMMCKQVKSAEVLSY